MCLWPTHVLHSVPSMPICYVDLKDAVECLQNLPVEDDCLVGVVADTHLS